jgi:hypothetical protein
MKWEYCELAIKTAGFWDSGAELPEGYIGQLNELGEQGWELVQAVPLPKSPGITGYVAFVLKRPLE